MRDATGNELLALRLEDFVANYQPPHWCETLQVALGKRMCPPIYAECMFTAHKDGSLETLLAANQHWNNPNVIDAVKAFFSSEIFERTRKEILTWAAKQYLSQGSKQEERFIASGCILTYLYWHELVLVGNTALTLLDDESTTILVRTVL